MAKYTYTAIRFVPDPMKGEFVNVGMIAGSDAQEEWGIKTIQRTGRATALMATGSRTWSSVSSQIADIQSTIDEFVRCTEGLRSGMPEEMVSESWLESLSNDYQNMLQFSRPMPVLGESVDDVLDSLWPVLIEEPDARKSTVSKSSIRSSIAKNLRHAAHKKGGNVVTSAKLQTRETHADIDVVTHNGRVAHIAQCYSFDVADLGSLLDSVKSWGWTVRDLRENGGSIAIHGMDVPVADDVRVDVVYYAPDRGDSRDAFREAKSVFDDDAVHAITYERSHFEEVVETAVGLLGDH